MRARVRVRPISLNRAALSRPRFTIATRSIPGAEFAGPAIVEERESTLIIGARGRARVDERLNVIVELTDGK